MKRIVSYLYFQYAIAHDLEEDEQRAKALVDALDLLYRRSRAARNWLNRWSVVNFPLARRML